MTLFPGLDLISGLFKINSKAEIAHRKMETRALFYPAVLLYLKCVKYHSGSSPWLKIIFFQKSKALSGEDDTRQTALNGGVLLTFFITSPRQK